MSSLPPEGTPEWNESGTPGDFSATGNAAVPAGWYPTPSGEQQFWDGTKWLALPPPLAPAGAGGVGAGPSRASLQQRRKWLVIALGVVILFGLIGGGIAWKAADDARQAEVAAQAAADASAKAAAERSAAEEREAQEREDAAAAAQKERDDAERDSRRASVTEIEASVEKMAKGHSSDGVIDGPIIDVSCSPVGGGSTDDLTEQTTVFECFVANEDNGDGTMSGYTYSATMNWSTGSFTYGLGAP